jgi:hypothetical protein
MGSSFHLVELRFQGCRDRCPAERHTNPPHSHAPDWAQQRACPALGVPAPCADEQRVACLQYDSMHAIGKSDSWRDRDTRCRHGTPGTAPRPPLRSAPVKCAAAAAATRSARLFHVRHAPISIERQFCGNGGRHGSWLVAHRRLPSRRQRERRARPAVSTARSVSQSDRSSVAMRPIHLTVTQ